MKTDVAPEQEEIVKEELKSGNFRTAAEVIGEVLQALQKKEQSAKPGNGAQREAVREMLGILSKRSACALKASRFRS